MTVIGDYGRIIYRLKSLDGWDDRFIDSIAADSVKAITELAERCQAAETRCKIVDKFESLMREMAEEDSTE